jgi:hypothetical protein
MSLSKHIPGSQHKKNVLYDEGYTYHVNHRVPARETIYYKCKVLDCPGRGISKKGVFAKSQEHSNHQVTPNKEEKGRLLESMKDRAEKENIGFFPF